MICLQQHENYASERWRMEYPSVVHCIRVSLVSSKCSRYSITTTWRLHICFCVRERQYHSICWRTLWFTSGVGRHTRIVFALHAYCTVGSSPSAVALTGPFDKVGRSFSRVGTIGPRKTLLYSATHKLALNIIQTLLL
jgi:hypothetical protein